MAIAKIEAKLLAMFEWDWQQEQENGAMMFYALEIADFAHDAALEPRLTGAEIYALRKQALINVQKNIPATRQHHANHFWNHGNPNRPKKTNTSTIDSWGGDYD